MPTRLELLLELNRALARQETLISIHIVEAGEGLQVGAHLLLFEDGRTLGSLGDSKLDTLACAQAKRLAALGKEAVTLELERFEEVDARDYRGVRVYFEILRPQPQLLVCGAGHIARALVQMGLVLGFRAAVVDDRPEFASRQFFPDSRVELLVGSFQEVVSSCRITPATACVIVTRGHRYDEDCLRILLSTSAGYIGMIGSRRRVGVVKERLSSEGFPESTLKRLHAPIGLDIGARTPEEIALAILSEIVLVRNCGRDYTESSPLSSKRLGKPL